MKKISMLLSIFIFMTSFVFAKNDENLSVNDRFYRKAGGTHTSYLWLRSDGSYKEITREHVGVDESDRGTWMSGKAGEFILTSEERVKSIGYKHISIGVSLKENVVNQEGVRQKIMDFLQTRKDAAFQSDEVEDIAKDEAGIPELFVYPYDIQVPREELEGIANTINKYLKDEAKNVFLVREVEYKGITYLSWEDEIAYEGGYDKEIREKIDNLQPGQLPPLVFIPIQKKVFEKETKISQPFIYHPESNEKFKER